MNLQSGNTTRMENGGKRKRVGLSLKSFKKPALNYVKKQPVGQCLTGVSSSKGKSNSRLEKLGLTRQEEIIETPISENRMKLLSLMPKFPRWESMDPFPLNPLMKALTESKSEINYTNTEIHVSNGNTTKKIKTKNYTDLPKHGFHYLFHKIKTQLITSYESDQSYIKTDTLTASEVDMNSTEIIEHEVGHDGSKSEDLKYNSVHKGRELKVDVNLNRMKDDEIELGNVFGSTDKTLGRLRPSQSKSAVVKIDIDLTDDIEDDSKFDFDDFGGNGQSPSNQSNIGTGTKVNRPPNSIGACVNGNVKTSADENNASVNAKSASIKDKTSNRHNQTICQFKNVANKKMKQYKFGFSKPTCGKPYTNVSKTSFENTVYGDSNVMIPNSPPRGDRKMMKSRPTVYRDSHLQGSRSTGISVRQDMSKVNSFYRTSYTETQSSKFKSKSPYGNKATSKCNSLSKTKSGNQHDDARKSLGKIVNKSNDNRSLFGSNYSEPHVEANNSFEKPVFASKDISKFNRLDTREDQHPYAKNTLKNSAHVSKGNSIYNSALQTRVEASKLRETSCSESNGISKANAFDNATHRCQHGQTIGKASQTNKTNPKRNNFYTTEGKQTYLQSSKGTFAYENISKTNATAKTTNNLRTSDSDYGPPKDMDGGLGSDEDLFGSDDGLDELLAKSFDDDLDHDGHLGTQGDNKDLKGVQNDVINDDDGMKDFLGNLDNDMDDDTLVACCDDVMSPTIPVREKGPNSGLSGSLRNEIPLKGVKRKLNIPDALSKIRRPNICDNVGYSRGLDKLCDGDANERIRECPFCAKSFHSGFSKGDIDQHIAMCCSSEDIGNDDAAFW